MSFFYKLKDQLFNIWYSKYHLIAPLLLYLLAMRTKFISLDPKDLYGYRISFESSLNLLLGTIISLYVYKLDSQKDMAAMDVKFELIKSKLHIKIINTSKINYLKNVSAYIYSSDQNLSFQGFSDSTEINLSHKFFLENINGKCLVLSRNVADIPNDDSFVFECFTSPDFFDKNQNKKINFQIKISSENARTIEKNFSITTHKDGFNQICER